MQFCILKNGGFIKKKSLLTSFVLLLVVAFSFGLCACGANYSDEDNFEIWAAARECCNNYSANSPYTVVFESKKYEGGEKFVGKTLETEALHGRKYYHTIKESKIDEDGELKDVSNYLEAVKLVDDEGVTKTKYLEFNESLKDFLKTREFVKPAIQSDAVYEIYTDEAITQVFKNQILEDDGIQLYIKLIVPEDSALVVETEVDYERISIYTIRVVKLGQTYDFDTNLDHATILSIDGVKPEEGQTGFVCSESKVYVLCYEY